MMITFLVETLGLTVIEAKILSEGILWLPNFVIQRDIVFRTVARDEALAAER
jgi:hypothetical protein